MRNILQFWDFLFFCFDNLDDFHTFTCECSNWCYVTCDLQCHFVRFKRTLAQTLTFMISHSSKNKTSPSLKIAYVDTRRESCDKNEIKVLMHLTRNTFLTQSADYFNSDEDNCRSIWILYFLLLIKNRRSLTLSSISRSLVIC